MMNRRSVIGSAVAATAAAAASKAGAALASRHDLPDEHDALGLAELVAKREVSPGELLSAAIARAEAVNPKLNFLARKHYDYARQVIARGVPNGPFAGVPWLIKDLNTYLDGTITGNGSRFYQNNVASFSSELVKRYERAGLVIFGKTTCPEFGLSGTTESAATGATHNPWNPNYTSGGSSGGAAVAVAAGVLPAAHATDGGGSIRIPSSCCGVFGLKPSRGRVPMGPPLTEGWGGMSVHHAVTLSVRDSAALLDAVAGIEPGSRYGAPTPERPYLEEARRDPAPLRIALVMTPPAGSAVDPECAQAAEAAARLCERLGHHVEPVTLPIDADAIGRATFAIIGSSVANMLRTRSAATGIKIGPDVVEPVTLMYNQMAQKMTGMDVVHANDTLQALAIQVAQFMQSYDLILSPTLAELPQPLGQLSLDDVQRYMKTVPPFTPYTGIENMTGQPSMSVPLGMSRSGLPIGVMFSARYGDEATLFRLAGQLERAAPWAKRRPPIHA